MNADPRIAVKRAHRSGVKSPKAKKKLQTTIPSDSMKEISKEFGIKPLQGGGNG